MTKRTESVQISKEHSSPIMYKSKDKMRRTHLIRVLSMLVDESSQAFSNNVTRVFYSINIKIFRPSISFMSSKNCI